MLLSNIHMDLLNMPLNQMSTVTATAMRIRLARTAKFMKAMHGEQKDKQGVTYWHHPYRVMLRLMSIPNITEGVLHAALLHDIVEDTRIHPAQLWQMGYPWNTLVMVDQVTRDKKALYRGETYMQWIAWIAMYGRMGTKLIKIADIADNTAPSRLVNLPAEMQGIETKYYRALEILRRSVPEDAFDAIRFGDFVGPHYLEPTVDFNMLEAFDAEISGRS